MPFENQFGRREILNKDWLKVEYSRALAEQIPDTNVRNNIGR